MATLSDRLTAYKGGLKPVSIARYSANIKKIFAELDVAEGVEGLNDTAVVMVWLDGKNPNTRKAYLNAIIVYLGAMGVEESPALTAYKEARDVLNAEYFSSKADNKKNDREADNMITFEEWDGVIAKLHDKITAGGLLTKSKLTRGEYLVILQWVSLSLYRAYPMRGEYGDMKIVKMEPRVKPELGDGVNYLIVKPRGMQFIINTYKTAGTYGRVIINIDKATVAVLRAWLSVRVAKEGVDDLLTRHNGGAVGRNALSKLLVGTFSEYLGKAVGVQMLRKSYLTAKYGDVLEEQKRDAVVMGHSVATGSQIYTKTD